MPRKDLQEFLKERLIALNPLEDVSSGGRADTEVIQPTLGYFGVDAVGPDVRSMVMATIRNQHPELGLLPDGVVDDAVAKVHATLSYAISREITLVKARLRPDPRIHTIESAALLPGALFVPLDEGGRSVGTARLYYLAPISETARPENIFYARTGVRFAPVDTQYISKDEMRLNVENGQYYFDVSLVAVDAGESGNIDPGSIDRAPSITRSISVTNKLRFWGGSASDTVSSLLAKAASYPTQLSLSVPRGIRAIIDRQFPGQAHQVQIVGKGDPDMMRDIIKGGNYGPVVLWGTRQLASHDASFVPSLVPSLRSDIMQILSGGVATFEALGLGLMTDDYYLIIHGFQPPTKECDELFESRIVEVSSNTVPFDRVRVADPIIPLATGLVWEVRHKRLTISDVPGGIEVPTTADGTVEIRDGEIHIGDKTDVYVSGGEETSSSDIAVASDEDELASGDTCHAGGGSLAEGWADPGGWERLDCPDTVLIGASPMTTVWVINDSFGSPRGVKFALYKGRDDISMVRCRPGLIGFVQKYRGNDDSWYSDIITLLQAGVWQRYRIQRIEVDDTISDNDGAFIFWVDRNVSVPISAGQIVRPIPDGITNGMMFAADGRTFRIVDWGTGWYHADHTIDYRGEIRIVETTTVDGLPAPYPDSVAWRVVDDVDIDLSDPKVLRTSGSDLRTVSASSLVNTTGSTDFASHGVQQNDVLRILSGPDAGDHTITADPSGPGHTILTLSESLTASGSYRYEIYGPQTPVSLPLVDVTTATLLDDTGAISSEVPYAAPLGASSSQFTNAGVGLKWRWTTCRTGIVGRSTVFYPLFPSPLDATHYLELTVYSKTWGYIHKKLDSGAYALTTQVGLQNFLNDLNANLPADYFVYLHPDTGAIVLPADIPAVPEYYLLAVSPFDADESIQGFPGASLRIFGVNVKGIFDSWLDDDATITSRHVSLDGIDVTDPTHPTISRWNDLVEIETGLNRGIAQVAYSMYTNTMEAIPSLYPLERSLLPEWNVIVRIGSPSTGLARTFFRDPTMVQVGPRTTYAAGDLQFMPDPRLNAVIATGSGDPASTYQPAGLHVAAGSNEALLPQHATFYGVEDADALVPGNRDMWFSWDFRAFPVGDGDWTNPAATVIHFVFDDGTDIAVSFVAGSSWTRADLVTEINRQLGETMALAKDLTAGPEVVAIRTTRRILRVTGDTVHFLGAFLGPAHMAPATFGSVGNLSYIAQECPAAVIIRDAVDPMLIHAGAHSFTAAAEVVAEAMVQFTIQRTQTQRWSAAAMAAQVHETGLYYVDVELIGKGAGNEWNLAPDTKLDISGSYRSLGYMIRPTNTVFSGSMHEVPVLSVTPYASDPALADDPKSELAVYGSGLRLAYRRSGLVEGIQDLADSDSERETNEDVLVRTMRPCEIYGTVQYTGGPSEAVATQQITELIESKGATLDVSEIVSLLLRLGADSVDTPVQLAAVFMNQDRTYSVVVGPDRVDVSRLQAFLVGGLTVRRTG